MQQQQLAQPRELRCLCCDQARNSWRDVTLSIVPRGGMERAVWERLPGAARHARSIQC